MKSTLLFCAIILYSVSGFSQFKGHLKEIMQNRKDADVFMGILQKQLSKSSSAAKTTGTMKRLKAGTYRSYGDVQDSVTYMYSNGRGSVHKGLASYAQVYSPVGMDVLQNIFCDSSIDLHYYQGTEYPTYDSYKYDNNNRTTEYKATLSLGYTYGYQLSYNQNGRLETVTTMDHNGPSPVATAKQYNFYNSQNMKTLDSTYSIFQNRPSRKREYTYDANGNRTSYTYYIYDTIMQKMRLDYKISYTYDNSNRLVTTVTEGDYGQGWSLQSKDSLGYTGSSDQYTYFGNDKWDAVNQDWEHEDIVVYNLNGKGDVADYIFYSWNGSAWDTLEKDVCTYSSDQLLTTIRGYLYNGNGGFSTSNYDGTDYYYEEYNPVGVTQKIKETIPVSVYPNPTTGQIYLDAATELKGNVRIVNAMGQCVMQLEKINIRGSIIDVSDLPGGNYLLYIQGAEGQRISEEQFVKF